MHAQITLDERYAIAALRQQGLSIHTIARELSRAASTISRELSRNRTAHDGCYRPSVADSYARVRRSRSRRNSHFTAEQWRIVDAHLKLDWSPEQISGRLARDGILSISHETIYVRVWHDKRAGGTLWKHLRQAAKKRRKRYGSRDSRGRVPGKRHISDRPDDVDAREAIGHWEIDTMMGTEHGRNSVVTLVERATGYLEMGKLERHCSAAASVRSIELIRRNEGLVTTVTADNGSEFHGFRDIEEATGATFYFATPHHSWERGTNENTNGLIRQYLPKRRSMAEVTQGDCDRIAGRLNARPRKRLGYQTPEECYVQAR